MARGGARDRTEAPRSRTDGRGAPTGGLKIRRRTFLQLAGLSASSLTLPLLPGCRDSGSGLEGPSNFDSDFTVHLLRRDDLVVLRIDFVGLTLNDAGDALVPTGSGDALMVVTHPAQHLLERALEETNAPASPPQPIAARLSGLSRIAFDIPKDLETLPLTIVSLLDACAQYPMRVALNALPPDPEIAFIEAPSNGVLKAAPGLVLPPQGGLVSAIEPIQATRRIVNDARLARGAHQIARSSGYDVTTTARTDARASTLIARLQPKEPTRPGPTETAIELPYRMLISPNRLEGWVHSHDPVASPSGRVELWHTRLGVRTDDGTVEESAQARLRTVRALWTRDPGFDPEDACSVTELSDDPPFVASLSQKDRIKIVHQSANFSPGACGRGKPEPGRPKPVKVNRLMLTSLGGWLDSLGDWGHKPWLGLESWQHRATLGRDHYVKVVYSGYLYPLGHRANLIKITERKLTSFAPHTEYLWQRKFLIVREPIKTYSNELRQFPFLTVHLKTLITPPLSGNPDEDHAFVPKVDSTIFRFAAEALDREGNVVQFDAGLAWVPAQEGVVTDMGLDSARSLYSGDVTLQRLSGQRFAFASAARPDDTSFEVQSVTLGEPDPPTISPPSEVKFLPAVLEARLCVEALRQLAGSAATQSFKYAQAYLDHGFQGGNNSGQLFLEAVDKLPVSFLRNSERSGGFVAPSLDVTGLSRLAGPVAGDLTKIADNHFDPATFLDSIDAKLFGVFDLKDVIQAALPADGGLLQAPRFVTQSLDEMEALLGDVEALLDDLQSYQQALASLGNGMDSVAHDVETDAGQLLDDIAAIDPDPSQIEAGLDKVVGPDLSSLSTSTQALVAHLSSGAPDGVTRALVQTLSRRSTQLAEVLQAAKPTLKETLRAFVTSATLAKNLTVKLDWRPRVRGFPTGGEIFAPQRADALLLSAELRGKGVTGKPAGVDLLCSLEDFDIHLIAPNTFLTLKFDRIAFSVHSGKKPDVDVAFGGMQFDGVLHFVEKLREIIPLQGFSDPPSLDVSPEGIESSFGISLPNLAVGVFSLQNINLHGGFRIPFVGDPLSVSFYFCTRDNPFNLTVSMLGGGGFFGIQVSPGSVLVLEAALEFGASVSVDFGVASGGVSIMAGIYFRLETSEAQLSGYLRIRGSVDVLGLITASIEMLMELVYEFSSRKLVGRATIEIEVSVAFFSKTVSVTAERKFAGSNADPTFEELMAPEGTYRPWEEYLGAFSIAA